MLESILLLICFAAAWFFAGIETGVISINRLRLRHLVRRKVPGAETIQLFVRNTDLLFGTVLVGNNIACTVASITAVGLATERWGPRGAAAAGVLTTLIILIFCEFFPKAWFQSFPAARCLPFAPLLNAVRLVLTPLSVPLMFVVRHVIPVRARNPEKNQPFITREEIIHLAGEGKSSGILTAAEHQMIHDVIQLKTKACREIMTPRDKIVSVRTSTTVAQMVQLARVKEHNRFPVFDDRQGAFVGIVHIFDVLADPDPGNKTAADYMRPPQMVADHTPVDHVLPRMRVTRQPLVLVSDERLEVIGLVTLEDVLDEVVGRL